MEHFFAIIGGMGTQATESYLHLLNQRTPATNDQEYLNYVLINHATISDRSSFLLGESKQDPAIQLAVDIQTISQQHPDFIVIACNTAHFWFDQLQALTPIKIINMPKLAVTAVKQHLQTAKRVGVLGTPATTSDGLYENELIRQGLEPVLPTKEIQTLTSALIFDEIKAKNHVDGAQFHSLIAQMMIEMKCDVVILGCTELSLANEREPENEFPVIDAQSLLVDETIQLASEFQKKTWRSS